MSVSLVSKGISWRCTAHAVKGTFRVPISDICLVRSRCDSPLPSLVSAISSRQLTSASTAPKQEPTNPSENHDTTPVSETRRNLRIVAAAVVQRMPLLVRDKPPLQLRYEEMIRQTWLERSKLSDFELEELEFERMKQDRIKKALDDTYTKAISEGADDFEDLQESREMELQEFKPAPRLTEADVSGDMRSLNRKLDRVLYMLVKKPRKDHSWQMPQGGVEGEESLLEAAQREFLEECGPDMKIKFYSPTPQAVFSYTHPSSSTLAGSKVFFMKAVYNDGEVQLDQRELSDYAWVTKEEMQGYVTQEYYKTVEPILME